MFGGWQHACRASNGLDNDGGDGLRRMVFQQVCEGLRVFSAVFGGIGRERVTCCVEGIGQKQHMRDDIVKRQVLAVGGNAADSGGEHGGAMVITVAGDDDVAVGFTF